MSILLPRRLQKSFPLNSPLMLLRSRALHYLPWQSLLYLVPWAAVLPSTGAYTLGSMLL